MESISFLHDLRYTTSKVIIPKRCTVKVTWPDRDAHTNLTYIDSDIYVSFKERYRGCEPPDSTNLPFRAEHDSIITQNDYEHPECSHVLGAQFNHKLAFYSEEKSKDGTRSFLELEMTKAGVEIKRFNNIMLERGADENYNEGFNNINLVKDGKLNISYNDDNSSEDSNDFLTPSSTNTTTTESCVPAADYKFGPNLDIVFKYSFYTGDHGVFTCVKSPFSGTNPMRVYIGKC